MRTDEVTRTIIGAAIEVHRVLGPGHREHIYEACLAHEARERGLVVVTQVAFPLVYKALRFEGAYRADLIASDVLVELKCVEAIDADHVAQTIGYLRASGLKTALILNFSAAKMRHGIRRVSL